MIRVPRSTTFRFLSLPLIGLLGAAMLQSAFVPTRRATAAQEKSSQLGNHGQANPTAPMMMPTVVPLFIEDGQFTSTLVLVNGTLLTTYADVIVTDLEGQEIARQRVEFSPHSQRRVKLAEMLSTTASGATAGRIEIMQSPDLKGMSIAAQLSLTYTGSGKPNYIDEETAMPSADGSQTLRAVTDVADGTPLIAITSLSESEQHIALESFNGKATFAKSITLPPGATLMTEANGEKTMSSAPLVFETTNRHGPGAPVAIALTSDAAPGSFAAFGLAPHSKKDGQSFTAINFADPKMLNSSNTVFAGVPVGFSSLLSEGRYAPQLALANFSTRVLDISVKYARTSGDNSTAQEVAKLQVSPRSSRSLSLENLKGDPELKNSFLEAIS